MIRRAILALLAVCAASAFAAPSASATCGAFAGADCSHFDLDGLGASGVNAPGSDFYLTQFVDTTLTDFDLHGSFIAAANFTGARITGSNFSGMNPGLTTATSTLFDSAYVRDSTFSGNLQWTQFVGADMRGVDFSGANLQNANFDAANLSGADFSGADLSGAQLDAAVLAGADFTGADLSWANLDSAGAQGASFRNTTMLGTQMTGMLAQQADFTGAAIFRADVSYVDLSTAKIGFYLQPTTALGLSWSYASAFLPRIIDVAAYTCQTQIAPEDADDPAVPTIGYTPSNIDSNDCSITIDAIIDAVKEVAGLFDGGDEIQAATIVEKVIEDLAENGYDLAQPELKPWLNMIIGNSL
jgi:uncharacterized protein YjbI with pentapeptide repeats